MEAEAVRRGEVGTHSRGMIEKGGESPLETFLSRP